MGRGAGSVATVVRRQQDMCAEDEVNHQNPYFDWKAKHYSAAQLGEEAERDLKRRIPAEKFKEEVRSGYYTSFPDDTPPDDELLGFLYKLALTWVVTYQTAFRSRTTIRTPQWKKHRRWTKTVLKQIQELTGTLKSMIQGRVAPHIQDQIKDVQQQLEVLRKFISTMEHADKTVEQESKWNLRNLAVRWTREMLEVTLKSKVPNLSKERLAQLISSAIVAVRLKPYDDVEATSRGLRRQARKLRIRNS
jgi:hypothetical protein